MVTQFGQALAALIQSLQWTLRSQAFGIGIAAPQMGISKQVAIVDVSARIPGAKLLTLINPEILRYETEKISKEGCMSLPDYSAYLKRYERVVYRTQDVVGKTVEREASGIEAVCIQHEIDHLNGVLFIDRVVSLKTDMLPRKKST